MFCGNYTARDTPALPSDTVRKVCRQKPKDKNLFNYNFGNSSSDSYLQGSVQATGGGAAEGCTGLEWGLHGAGMGDGISEIPLLGWDMNLLLHRRRKKRMGREEKSCHSCWMAGKWLMESGSRDARQDPPFPTYPFNIYDACFIPDLLVHTLG